MIDALLFGKIAPAIGRGILHLWLKDYRADAASGAVDVVQAAFASVRDRSAANRIVSTISERVAEDVLRSLKDARGEIDSISDDAVLHAVFASINDTTLTAELLVDRDLDPNLIAQALITGQKESLVGLNSSEVAVYELLVRRICNTIVDVSSELPAVQPRAMGRLLENDRQIIDSLSEMLDRLEEIRQQSIESGSDRKSQLFDQDYRLAVGRKLDRLELFGVDLKTSRRQQLSIAYISLELNLDELNHADQQEQQTGSVRADDLLTRSTRFLIRGLAGSGKTTLLSWIAVNAANRTFPDSLKAWNDLVPFFIPLRSYAGATLPVPEKFPVYCAPNLLGEMPAGWVHEKLRAGKAIVLIDGIDEIEERDEVIRWIEELVETFESAVFIVTSRPPAVDPTKYESIGFIDAELLPMSSADVGRFIDHWHRANLDIGASSDSSTSNEALASRLKQSIRENRSLRGLATNPLLCAMLCALHRDRNQHLPKDRIELYEACSAMLLHRRDEERSIKVSLKPELTMSQKELLVQYLAYFMISNNWSEIDFARATSCVERVLPSLGIPDSRLAPKILALLVERSGVLREPTKHYLDFSHRTFQEFYAAKQAAHEDHVGVLVKNALSDQWREVIILAAGLGSKRFTNELMQTLLDEGDNATYRRHHFNLLAVACLETGRDIDGVLRTKIGERISQLVPPKNISEAKALASAGELAVGPLREIVSKKKKSYATEMAATIRALAIIGSPAALSALESLVSQHESRSTVISELLRAMEYFDNESEFCRRILSNVPIETIHVNSIESASYLNLARRIVIRYAGDVISYSMLSSLRFLKELVLEDVHVMSQFAGLTAITGLVKLTIRYDYTGIDLSSLNPHKTISDLSLIGDGPVYQAERLASLENLRKLEILGRASWKEIQHIRELDGLRTLIIAHLESDTELSRIVPEGLKHLSIHGSQIEVNSVNVHESLEVLSLRNVRTGNTLLQSLPNLRALELVNTDIPNMEEVKNLKQLGILSVWEAPYLKSIEGLETLPKLTVSQFHNCPILLDVCKLAESVSLKTLSLWRTPASENMDCFKSTQIDFSRVMYLHRVRFMGYDHFFY
ncbi:MAG: NACHT domain-containing protein [Chloroflexi bacterium]|nr:NACHT domain-containing protein [Chloroflexota bacterium]